MLIIKNGEIIHDVSELPEFKFFVESKKNDITNALLLKPMFLQERLKEIRQQIIQESFKYIWKPSIEYRGPDSGMDESGFGCSGFITFLLKKFGLNIDWIGHVNEYFDAYGVSVHEDAVLPWDLIFFSWDGYVPLHMWLMISDKEYIHAPWRNSQVKITRIKKKNIANTSGNIIYTKSPIWFKRIVLHVKDWFDYNKKQNGKRYNKII